MMDLFDQAFKKYNSGSLLTTQEFILTRMSKEEHSDIWRYVFPDFLKDNLSDGVATPIIWEAVWKVFNDKYRPDHLAIPKQKPVKFLPDRQLLLPVRQS